MLRPWAPHRRALGLLKSPQLFPMRFFGKLKPGSIPDIFHATACVFPEWKSPVEIATVHDLVAVCTNANSAVDEVRRLTAYIHRADRIVCVSRHTRAHLHALLDIPEQRTVAIPLAADESFKPASPDACLRLRKRYGLPTEFLIFVGRYRWNKNLDRLLQAYALSGLDIPLYMAGAFDKSERARVMQAAAQAGCAESIEWLRAIKQNELPALMSCASALCMPSTFEGFGLPIVEAMACGTPVLTSAGCATEETAGGHAVLVEPLSIESIANGLRAVLEVTQEQRVRARLHAARRSWADVAAETWQVYCDAYRAVGVPAVMPMTLAAEPGSARVTLD